MSTSQLNGYCDNCGGEYLYEHNNRTGEITRLTMCGCDKERWNYKTAFNILMEYFDCIPEDERLRVSKQLKAMGL